MRFAALMASFFIHLVLILGSLTYIGTTRPLSIDLDREIHMVELVYLAQPEPEPAPAPPEIPAPKPPEPPRPEPVPSPPEPKVEVPAPPTPEPEPRPEPKPEPKPAPRPEPEPEPARERAPTPEEIMAQELAALRRDVERSAQSQAPREQAGLLEIYAAKAEAWIRANWRPPPAGSTQDLVVQVRVGIDSTGRIHSARIMRSSGRELFDNSALRAVEDTGQLPEPPPRGIRELDITFHHEDQR